MSEDASIATLAQSLVSELTSLQQTVATAESCTGGWIAKAITDIPGSSACFGYGIVSYSNAAKQSLLGVEPHILDAHGAVSEECVAAMSKGALDASRADYSVAVSGVAGPGGGSPEKPVGTVWFAWSGRTADKIRTNAAVQHVPGDRDQVRSRSVVFALAGLLERVRDRV